LAKVENAGPNKVKIEVSVSPEVFAEALQKAYLKTRGKFSIQGFRKGKAPKPVIENYYGESIFFEDAFEFVFPESYTNTIDELGLFPVSKPEIDIKAIGKTEGATYTAEFFVKPEVELGKYKGVKAEKKEADIDDKNIDEEINRTAERNARWVDVDREAKENDKAIIDYSGSVDGEMFEGGTAENQVIEIGSGTFIPGFEEQIKGMKKGEEKDISVKFPEDYRAEHLAGKDAVFHIKLNDVKEKELPELGDDFAQDVSEFDTLEEYKADIRKRLTEREEEHAKMHTQNNVIEEVIKNAKIDLPECMIENQIDNQIRKIEYSLMYQGVKLEDYLKMTGGSMEALRNEYRETSEKTVRAQLVVEAVKKAEGIEASEEQLEEELKRRAESAKKDLEEFKKTVSEKELNYIKEDLAYDNTVNFLVDNAVLMSSGKKGKKKNAGKENNKSE
jgi:trigger factor